MASLNKVMLIGNLTRDPEVRYTPKQTAVAELGLAVNRVYTADNQERREETTFIDVTLWGRQAELAGQYLAKGRSVYIEGRLQLDQWEDKATGQNRSKLRVVAENIQFLGGRNEAPGGGGGGGNFQPRGGQQQGGYQQGGGYSQQPSYDEPGGSSYSSGGYDSAPSSAPAKSSAPAQSFAEEDDDIPF